MITVFILYLVITIGLAWWYSRGPRTNEDFVIGGKRFGGTALALSERATGESAWLLLGLTGEAFAEGFNVMWVALGCVTGIIFIWLVMAERLRRETEKAGVMTVAGLIARKIPGSEKAISLLSASIIVFFFIFYIAAQFSGSGKVLHKTFGLDPFWGIIIGSVVVTVYCMLGGFIAVVVTDVFQSLLMILTLVVFPFIALMVASQQGIPVVEMIGHADPIHLSLTNGQTGWMAFLFILSGLSWALGYTGQPQLLTRMMAFRNASDIRRGQWVAIIWTVLAYTGAILIGLFGIALLQSGHLTDEAGHLAGDAEKILPVMVIHFVHPILAGVLLSGVISAMMSTAATELTVSSASIGEDMISKLHRKAMTNKGKLIMNQMLTLAVGIIAIILALTLTDTVYGLVSYAWSGIGSSFGPALILILFWKKISRAGIIASLVSGTAGTILWKIFFLEMTGISERLISFAFAFLMAVAFSIIIPERKRA